MDAAGNCTAEVGAAAAARFRKAEKLEEVDRLVSWWHSPHQVSETLEIPSSTLHHWLRQRRLRVENSPCPSLASFFESRTGLELLHRLLIAAHLVFVEANACGIRSLCKFLELSGLDEFVASSFGAQHSLAKQIESLLIEFGEEEEQRLAPQMKRCEISVAEDETFHPQICLVAIEPVSNFLLLEQYAEQRDAETWKQCLSDKLAHFSVIVRQVVSDEAKALIAHAETHLGAHHSPDLFHVQQEL